LKKKSETLENNSNNKKVKCAAPTEFSTSSAADTAFVKTNENHRDGATTQDDATLALVLSGVVVLAALIGLLVLVSLCNRKPSD
jgi:hypothetical protein